MAISIAIDGPAAAGKSTVAKKVSEKLGYTYIDTGAMYRAFTQYVISKGVNPENEEAVSKLVPEVMIELRPDGTVLCNKTDVTEIIRRDNVSHNVSFIASYKAVRLALVDQQRLMASKSSVVMDGRDIGTYVLPNATVKIFQIASVATRAVRRYEENIQKNRPCTLEEVEQDIRRRDHIDSHREFAPLKPAPDSVWLDTSFMSIDEAVEAVLKIIKTKTEERDEK